MAKPADILSLLSKSREIRESQSREIFRVRISPLCLSIFLLQHYFYCYTELSTLKLTRNVIPLSFCKPCVYNLHSHSYIRVTKFLITLIDYGFSVQSEVPLCMKSSTATAFSAVLRLSGCWQPSCHNL